MLEVLYKANVMYPLRHHKDRIMILHLWLATRYITVTIPTVISTNFANVLPRRYKSASMMLVTTRRDWMFIASKLTDITTILSLSMYIAWVHLDLISAQRKHFKRPRYMRYQWDQFAIPLTLSMPQSIASCMLYSTEHIPSTRCTTLPQ